MPLAILIFLPLIVFAEIYEYQTSKGSVVYSDHVPAGDYHQTKSIAILTSNKLTSDTMLNKSESSADKLSTKTTINTQALENNSVIAITSPVDQQNFWNEREIAVEISIVPSLTEGSNIQIKLDGQNYHQPTTELKFILKDLNRGLHSIQALLLTANGEVVKQSPEVKIHVHYGTTNMQDNPHDDNF